MRFQLKPLCVGLITASLMSGCAVSYSDVANQRTSSTNESEKALAKQKVQRQQEGSLTRMNGNYLGDSPIELPYAATLPPQFFEKVIIRQRGANYGTVSQAAKNIGLATGIPIRVSADVEMVGALSGGAAPTGAVQNAASLAIAPGGMGVPLDGSLPGIGLPTGPGGVNTSANSPDVASRMKNMALNSTVMQARNIVRLDYQGQLLAYLNQVATTGGVNWEYKDNGIFFFRLQTKTFTLANASPGDISVADGMSKGGSASTGSTGGGNAQSTGSFSSTASVQTSGSWSVWKSIKPALDAAITVAGKLSINEATGSITVTDTKEGVSRVKKIVEHENEALGRQVSVDVRVIKVAINNNTQVGVDLNAIYTSMVGNTLALVAPATLTTAAAGTATFTVNNANSKWNGSTGALQALNQFGTIASDSTSTLITTNRLPAMTGNFATTGFLAQTTPAAGGATTGGQGVPGLTPGSITTGSFLRVTPTIKDNNTVMLNLSIDLSDLLGIGSATTGTGATLQQIQWADSNGTKSTSNILLGQNESMVMIGLNNNSVNSNAQNSLTGGSANANKKRDLFVMIVTPRIMRGI